MQHTLSKNLPCYRPISDSRKASGAKNTAATYRQYVQLHQEQSARQDRTMLRGLRHSRKRDVLEDPQIIANQAYLPIAHGRIQ